MNKELEIYKHLSELDSSHPGQAYLRGLYDTFEVNGSGGCHICLVHPPLHMTVSALQRRGLHQRYNVVLLRETLVRLFRALDFLHTVANVVHTGKLEDSILVSVLTTCNVYDAYFSCRHQGDQYHAYH